MVLFLKNVFHFNYEVFFSKKPLNFERGEKLENMMKKECFFEKKRFHLFKSLLYKNEKAQNMPLVAGRLPNYTGQVYIFFCIRVSTEFFPDLQKI